MYLFRIIKIVIGSSPRQSQRGFRRHQRSFTIMKLNELIAWCKENHVEDIDLTVAVNSLDTNPAPSDFYLLGDFNDQIGNVRVYNTAFAFKSSKYPMSTSTDKATPEYTDRIAKLGSSPKGEGHDNFLKGIMVAFDLTLSNKAWVEAERYHFLDFISSQSTMHRIQKFDIAKQCNEYVDPRIIEILKEYKEKGDYYGMLYNTPAGFRLTAGMATNYRQLKTIYDQRKNHRLKEWHGVCDWIETLPYMKDFLGLGTAA